MGGAPKAPNPMVTAGVQASQEASDLQRDKLKIAADRPTQNTPQGQIKWAQDANGNWTQDTTYAAPLAAANDVAMQNTLNSNYMAYNALNQANQQLYKPMSFDKAGQTGTAINTNALGPKGQALSALPQGGASIGGSAWDQNYQMAGQADNAMRGRIEDALYKRETSRLDPQYAQLSSQMENRLAQQGLSPTSAAYQQAMADFGRQRTDAYGQATTNAIAGGGQEMANQYNLNLAGIGQNNATRSGRINDMTSKGNYNEDIRNSRLNQQIQSGNYAEGLRSNRLNEGINAGNYNENLRSNRIGEMQQLRAQPMQEYQQLAAAGALQNPQFSGFNPADYTHSDKMGAYQNQVNAQQGASAAKGAQTQGMVGSGVALAGTAATVAIAL